MSNDKMGGPAFQHGGQADYTGGATLWDYYAAAALQGIMAAKEYSLPGWPPYAENVAGIVADAMLAERAKRIKDDE